jgi:hypothetical protein
MMVPAVDVLPTAAELRRYLRRASTLLAATECSARSEHLDVLRKATYWLRVALASVEAMARNVEAIPALVEEPLTGPIEAATMRIHR